MATSQTTVQTVYPDQWDKQSMGDAHRYCLQLVRRNPTLPNSAVEWSVSPADQHRYGFTLKGRLVALNGTNKINRRHAVFDFSTAMKLAEDLVEGVIETEDFLPLRSRLNR